MIFLVQNNDSNDPHFNLALEEFCLRKLARDRSLLLVYVNEPSVIIGRNQNILEEVNLPFAAQMGLHIVRRISGGGSVYHDLGNLNFSFIQSHNRQSLKKIQQTVEPVRRVLLKMGVTAEFNAKNDLVVAGKKVSGTAQFSDTKRIIIHGTLLFNSNLYSLRRSLEANVDLISSRALKSVSSVVANLSGCMSHRIDMDDFREMLLQTIAAKNRGLQDLTVSGQDWRDISHLAGEKYRSWEWTFGKAPAFRIRRSGRTPAGYLETMIEVESGCIAGIRFDKNINCIGHATTLESRLMGIPYHREAIRIRLSGADLRSFGTTLTANQLAEHLCDKGISGLVPGLQSALCILFYTIEKLFNNENQVVRQEHRTQTTVPSRLAACLIISLEDYCMRRLLRIILSMLLLTASVLGSHAHAGLETNIEVQEFTLDNGMLFLVVNRPTMPQVAVRLAIRAGSALEETGRTGIAHLLEHMMFKGTQNFGTLDRVKDQELQEKIEAAYQVVLQEEKSRHPDRELIQRKLSEMDNLRREVQNIFVPQAFSSQLGQNGAVGINAFTSQDQTQYIASVPSDMLEQWFSIISEQIFEPSWREFYVEKEVVQREWAFRYVNNPSGATWLDLGATAYTAHPYRNPTIGWRSDMEKFNTTDAMAFHSRYYNPTNAVCVLVGDLTVAKARRLAKIYFARYPAGARSPETVTSEPPQEGPRRNVRYLKGARTPLVRIGFHAAQMGTGDFYALDVMTMLLSQGRSARITQNLINKGLAVEAWAANPDNRYGGMVILGGSPNEPQRLKSDHPTEEERRRAYFDACNDLENLLLAEVDDLKDQPVTTRELERIKKLNQRDFIERMRSNESLASTLATLEIQTGWRYLNTYLDSIATVTPADVQRVARAYLRNENRTTTYVIPGGEPDKPPAAYSEIRSVGGKAAARTTRPVDLANHSVYPTPEGWRHPLYFERKPVKVTYPQAESTTVGGAPMFFMRDTELPMIDLTLLVKAGEVDIDPTETGLAELLNGSLVNGGTERHAPEALAQLLDENAIEVAVAVGEEDTTIRLSVLKDEWEKGLDLLQEILTQPAFRSDVVEVLKQQALIGLKRQGENAQAVAMREGAIWHFNGHPYGRDPLKGLETIPTIDRKDLKRFLRTYFVPSNMVLAVSGDVSREAAIAGVGRLMKSLPDDQAPARRLEDPSATPPVLALVPKAGQLQSQVVLYLNGPKRSDPGFWKLRLLTDIFGGSDSLMYTRLRDDLGLVYSAGFFQTYKWKAGMLIGYIGCKGDKTGMAIAETVDIMRKLRRGIPQDELERKRLEALNSFAFNVDTPHALVTAYARYQMRGEPLDTLDRIQDAFIGANKSELEELARRYLDPGRIQVVVVADKTVPVNRNQNGVRSLEEDLDRLAAQLDLPYREIALR